MHSARYLAQSLSMKTSIMEPMLPSDPESELADVALDLLAKSSALAGQVHGRVRNAIGDLVRSMNCYYSNLIEGRDTHPRDIEGALADRYSVEPHRRALQHEARAHVDLLRAIDTGEDLDFAPTSVAYVQWLHGEFYSRLPHAPTRAENPNTGQQVRTVPGEFRTRGVMVGRHVPPSADDLPSFLLRFEEAYAPEQLSRVHRILAVAAAHHRLLWIHPFSDGNGRVARLMSHAMLLRCGVGSSLWSAARGLSRNAEHYKAALARSDDTRSRDLNGAGALSDQALQEFVRFFLDTCINEVRFMESLLQPSQLLRRMKLYVDDEVSARRLPRGSLPLLREALLAGELERGRAAHLTGYRERRGRQVLSTLIDRGLLVSQGRRAPVCLGFPLDVLERWFPRLYPVD